MAKTGKLTPARIFHYNFTRGEVMPSNPWYKEYGVIGTLAVVKLAGSASTHFSLNSFKAKVTTRLALIEKQIEKIPPPEQVAHNERTNASIEEVKEELGRHEERLNRTVERFHQIIPRLLDFLDKVTKRWADYPVP